MTCGHGGQFEKLVKTRLQRRGSTRTLRSRGPGAGMDFVPGAADAPARRARSMGNWFKPAPYSAESGRPKPDKSRCGRATLHRIRSATPLKRSLSLSLFLSFAPTPGALAATPFDAHREGKALSRYRRHLVLVLSSLSLSLSLSLSQPRTLYTYVGIYQLRARRLLLRRFLGRSLLHQSATLLHGKN